MYGMLKKRRDFQYVQNYGRKHRSRHYLVIQRQNIIGIRRLGIIASKKIGGAVQRNRVKRVIREVFRLYENKFPESMDFVFVARKRSHELKMQEAAREILGCLVLNGSSNNTRSPGF
jgi:ribonuclease P protein component